jgi:hypothetical protein
MKITAALVLAVAAAMVFSGCAKRSIVVNKLESEPDFTIKKDIQIDWDQAQGDCEEILNDKTEYPKTSYIDTAVDEKTKTIKLIWVLANDATKEDALTYGPVFIKAFNDACHDQDFSIDLSTDSTYGTLWDRYNLNLQLYRQTDIMKPANYLVYQDIAAGAKDPVHAITEDERKKAEDNESGAAAYSPTEASK